MPYLIALYIAELIAINHAIWYIPILCFLSIINDLPRDIITIPGHNICYPVY